MERAEEIINAGLRIAAKGGLLAVSLSEVARQLECSHGTVAYHFKTVANLRRAISKAAVERKDEKVLPWLRAAGMKV